MVDKDLAAAVKAAKGGKLHHFALVGKTELSLARSKVSAGVLKEMRDSAGGGTAVIGTCIGSGEVLLFTAAKASSTMAAILKKCIKDKAGLTMTCEVSSAADEEAEPEPAESAEDDDGKAEEAKTAARKKRIVAAFTDLLKAKADKVKTSREGVMLARDLKVALDGGKLDEADKLLADLKATLA